MSAPTGAGKSQAFELAPYAFDRLLGEDCDAIVFVIFLLISMERQHCHMSFFMFYTQRSLCYM